MRNHVLTLLSLLVAIPSTAHAGCADLKSPAARLACYDQAATEASKKPVNDKGSVEGTVTWKYNRVVGSRADSGASIYLVKSPIGETFKKVSADDFASSVVLGFKHSENDLIFSTKADGYGKFFFDGIPAGKYIAILVSHNSRSTVNPSDFGTKNVIELLKPHVSKSLSAFHKMNWSFISVEPSQRTALSEEFDYTDY